MDPSVWLQIENKVRILLKDLLEPTIRRVSDTVKQVEKLAKTQSTIVFKLEDIDIAVLNIEKRLSSMDETAKKILEYEGSQAVMESRFNRDREELRSQLSSFSTRQENFEESLEVLQHQKDVLRYDITVLQQVIPNNKLELEEKIEAIKTKYRDNFVEIENKFRLIDINNSQFQKTFEIIRKEIVQIDTVAVESSRTGAQNTKNCKQLDKRIELIKNDAAKDTEKVRTMCFNNANEISKNMKEIKRIERIFKSDESNIKTEINMTDPFYSIFQDLPTLKNLASYDKERMERFILNDYSDNVRKIIYGILNKAKVIIDTPLPDPKLNRRKSISDTSSKKRKRKQRKNIKKQIALNISKATKGFSRIQTLQLDAHSAKYQNINTTTNMNENPTIFLKEDSKKSLSKEIPLNKPPEPVLRSNSNSKSNLPLIISTPVDTLPDNQDPIIEENDDHLSISRKSLSSSCFSDDSDDSQSFIDFTPMIEHVKFELKEEAHFMYIELKSNIDSLSQMIYSKIEEIKKELLKSIHFVQSSHDDFTSQFKKKMGEVEICIQQATYECNSASAQRKRDFNDNSAHFKKLSNGIDDLLAKDMMLTENIEQLSKTIDSLIDYSKVSLALQSQDEVDRESIALMGYQKKKKSSVVSIDKRCLSCTGQASAVLVAFKIACLAYEPSAVFFQDRKYTRKELLKLQNNILVNFSKTIDLDLSEDNRDIHNKTMLTSKQWRPLSVPPSRFSTLTSPHGKTPDTEILPSLRNRFKL